MAAVTHRVITPDTGNTPNTSGAFTPALGDLLVVFAVGSDTTTATATLSSSVGTTFTQVNRTIYNASAYSLYTFIADQLVTDTASQTVTFNTPGDVSSGSVISVYSVSQMWRVGADALRQVAEQENQAGGETPAPAFASSALTNNPTLGAIANISNPAGMTPPGSWNEGGDSGHGAPATGLETVFRDSGFTGTTITWGGTSATAFGSTIIELNADPRSKESFPLYIPPKKSIGLASLTIAVNLLQTTLAPVTQSYTNQEVILRDIPGIRLTWLNNSLQNVLQPTVGATYDLSLPKIGDRNPVAFTFARPQFYEDSIQQNQYDWPNPKIAARINPDWINSQKEEPVIPFVPVDQPNPKIAGKPVSDWIQARPQYYEDEYPKNQYDWPNPVLKIGEGKTWINNNQENTLAPFVGDPFYENKWPNPLRGWGIITTVSSRLQADIVQGDPFVPILYPNPIPKKIADNRTYVNTLLPIHFKAVPLPISLPNPTVRSYPVVNRTWISYPQLERVVGDPLIPIDQPNPQFKKVPVRDWIWSKPSYYVNPVQSSCPITLGIGAPGDITCFVLVGLETNPQPVTTPTNNPTFETPVVARPRAITWLQSRPVYYVDNFPTAHSVTNIPLFRKQEANKGFIQARPSNYQEPVVTLIKTQIWQNPVITRKGLIIESETRSGEPFIAGTPNRQRDWPNPTLRKKKGQDWIDYYVIDANLPTQPYAIFNNIPFRRKLIAQTWIQYPLVASPISALPFGKQFDVNPLRKKRLVEFWINPSLSVSEIPFNQTNYPNPRFIKYVTRFELVKPFYYEEQQPFVRNEYPNPIIKFSSVKDWINFIQIEEVNPIIPFDLSNPILNRKQVESWLINLLQSTLEPAVGEVPFAQNNYPNPALIKIGKDWIWNTPFYYVETIDPFRQNDWKNPIIIKRNQVGFINFVTISENPRAVQLFDIPVRKNQIARTWTQSLQESTLGPLPQTSFTQKDWPNPLVSKRNRVDHTDNLVYRIEGKVPFGFIEWRVPNRGLIATTWLYSSLVNLNEVTGDRPLAQYDWPLFRRIRTANDLLTLISQNPQILPQIKGRTICLLADATEFDLEATLENYDLEATITIFDLEAGGTECE